MLNQVAENATAKETAMATIHQTRTKAIGMARTFSVYILSFLYILYIFSSSKHTKRAKAIG
jgi:uncharacterized membrane protein YecN with MAPEG domain